MADKNIQMTQRNSTNDGWDNIYPKTTGSQVAASSGTTFEAHNSDTTSHITSTERSAWNAKQSALGFTPVNKAGDTMTGIFSTANNTGTITDANLKPLVVQSDSSHAACMTFIRNNAHAVQFGIDVDNQLKVGGWSTGTSAYKILDARDISGSGASGLRRINTSTGAPSGGSDGDIWLQYV
jgi:hypothetical protein